MNPKLEKVIKGLEICYRPPSKCKDCPYHDLLDEQSCNDVLCLDALTLLKEQPEIVRCKDCRYGEQTKNGAGGDCIQCNNDDLWLDGNLHLPDWFCADGEREDNDA